MKIFQVMVEDRHVDVGAYPFSTAEKAIAFAKMVYLEREPSQVDDEMGELPPPDGWLYYAVYTCEGDCIWVIERELDKI